MHLRIFTSRDEIAREAAQLWTGIASESVNKNNHFHIALAGGSTPASLYELMAGDEYRHKVDWGKTHIYFGDERCVPPDHEDSNFLMVKQAMLDRIPCPGENIHRMEGELEPSLAAAHYNKTLEQFLGKTGRFDLVLLGVGADGHTASLFPDTSALSDNQNDVAANYVEQLQTWRVTLTYRAINNARNVLILAAGKEKNPVLKEIFTENVPGKYPVQGVHPAGELFWFLDDSAARGIQV